MKWPLTGAQVQSCNGFADYPVQRLAENGDVEAMAHLGKRMYQHGCDTRTKEQGLQYLERASLAGHDAARTLLVRQVSHAIDDGPSVSACFALMDMLMPVADDSDLIRGSCD
ncbi:hypothetical protein [Tateyamaria omphalii]|uniref:hypothetical protein n=1 Tax=Tateyamaria omphalii TaxID=299262 RepID=UPI001E5212A2|nr:hypothetical protein [Tateyamaria omphalii]